MALVSVTCFMSAAQIADVMGHVGNVDVTVPLNAAFAKTKDRIHLPAGRYRVDGTLDAPTCATIEGDGQEVTTLVPPAGAGVFLLLAAGGPTEVSDFGIDGTRTSGAVGVRFGDATATPNNRWHGIASNLRIENFTGANAVGVHLADTIKSSLNYVRSGANTVNLLCKKIRPSGYPTSTVLRDCEFVNATGDGVQVYSGESIVFDHCLFEGNAGRGVLVDTADGGTVNNYLFTNRCWFEDNWHGADPNGKYVFDCNGPEGSLRVALRDPFFHANNVGKMIRFKGASVAGFVLDGVQVPNEAAMIRIEGGAYGSHVWAPNIEKDTVLSTG